MSTHIQSQYFTQALSSLLDEAFEHVHGYFLDKGTAMFETLSTVSAQEASIPVGGRCATLAAQVKHVAFYLDVLERAVRTGVYASVDWDEIWRTTQAVDQAGWETIKRGLRESYERVKALIHDTADWPSEREVGSAIAMIAHTAYHLGEIRQALCTLKSSNPRKIKQDNGG
ncbi:MAG: hypothetical protein ACOYYS_05695 [Chloroflexota bacterium]